MKAKLFQATLSMYYDCLILIDSPRVWSIANALARFDTAIMKQGHVH